MDGPFGEGWRAPAAQVLVTLAPGPIAQLAAVRQPVATLLAVVAGTATVVVAVLLHVRARRLRARASHARAHAQHLERAVELVYADWVDLQVARGLEELEQWRRSCSG